MTLKQLERALDIVQRCRQGAERAVDEGDRTRWSGAAERLELALRSRGYPGGARLGASFDEALERLIERMHALAP